MKLNLGGPEETDAPQDLQEGLVSKLSTMTMIVNA
jgi:hypothetical protein